MADVKWIKIVTDVFDDEKIVLIESMPEADSIIVIWFKLLCLAGKQNRDGFLMLNDKLAYTDEMLATVFRRPINTVRLALSTFENFGMIEIVEGAIYISNWEKHQNIDGLERIKEQNRLRKQRQRQRESVMICTNQQMSRDSHGTVTQCHATDIDIDKEKDKEKENSIVPRAEARRFSPPTIDEVKAYCLERKNGVDAERFVDHYTSNGWMVGRNRMKDWKAAVRTWERNANGNKAVGANGIPISNEPSPLDDIF